MRNFRDLGIWQDSTDFALQIYSICKTMPTLERFGIISQMQRAAVSIPSNIAEGASRSSDTDFARFLEISLGSAYEIETQLTIAKGLNYISEEIHSKSIYNLHSLQKRISSLIKTLKANE